MNISKDFELRNIAGSYVVIPIGENIVDFSSMITINEVGAFLWDLLKQDTTVEKLADALCSEYDVDRETAVADITEFVNKLKDNKVLS